MNYKIYQNGKEVKGELPFDLMRTEGVGIFESMRAYGGKILHEKEHLFRLSESAKTVGYKSFPGLEKLQFELKAALKAFGEKECYVRLTLWEGRSFVILGSREHPKELYEKGVALKTASFPRGGPSTFPWQAKASAYQQAILASTEPHPEIIYEWVFLDQEGSLTETRIGNFFIIQYGHAGAASAKKGGATLLTPPEHLILNGVTRRFVIKCALELGMQVRETPLTRHEFFNADEAFLCNTSWEVLPVRELDGRTIGTGKPGPVTVKLHRFFKRRVQAYVTSHRSSRADQRFR
ncbi:MAG: aminotransferase class IV family protein [Candidatus Omnitrophica bacterium]|nr:aminotransferase class IV family protein [Candidatus Omnitrophota bacterium]